jgi:hypothetical protein
LRQRIHKVKKETVMTQQIRQTETSGTMKAASVANYIVERLAAEGISHCFGVAGDYYFQSATQSTAAPR